MATLNETIQDAKKTKEKNDMPFATIWQTGKLFGFNFENKPVGYTEGKGKIKRTVLAIV